MVGGVAAVTWMLIPIRASARRLRGRSRSPAPDRLRRRGRWIRPWLFRQMARAWPSVALTTKRTFGWDDRSVRWSVSAAQKLEQLFDRKEIVSSLAFSAGGASPIGPDQTPLGTVKLLSAYVAGCCKVPARAASSASSAQASAFPRISERMSTPTRCMLGDDAPIHSRAISRASEGQPASAAAPSRCSQAAG